MASRLTVLAALLVSMAASADVLKMKTPTGAYKVTFDPKRIPRDKLKAALRLSPQSDPPAVNVVLEHCDPADEAYKPCGGAEGDENGLHNAGVNLERAAREVRAAASLDVPRALAEVKAYFLKSGRFYLWSLKTRMDFYRTEKLSVLKRTFRDIDASEACSASIKRIGESASRGDAFRLVRTDWHNCVNLVFNRKYGEYPAAAWERFLANYKIKASFEPVRSLAGKYPDPKDIPPAPDSGQ